MLNYNIIIIIIFKLGFIDYNTNNLNLCSIEKPGILVFYDKWIPLTWDFLGILEYLVFWD